MRIIELLALSKKKITLWHWTFLEFLENNYDPNLYSSSLYWMSEAFYHIKDYDNANDSYSEFLANSGNNFATFYAKAYYGLTYSNYKQDKYKRTIFWFREYIDNANPDNKGLINDALLRTEMLILFRKIIEMPLNIMRKLRECKPQIWIMLSCKVLYRVVCL